MKFMIIISGEASVLIPKRPEQLDNERNILLNRRTSIIP